MAEVSNAFIGLNLDPGTALVDTGAQVPLIGEPQLIELGKHLQQKYGRTYQWTNRTKSQTGGVGGKAIIIKDNPSRQLQRFARYILAKRESQILARTQHDYEEEQYPVEWSQVDETMGQESEIDDQL